MRVVPAVPLLLLALSLGACADRSSDDPVDGESPAAPVESADENAAGEPILATDPDTSEPDEAAPGLDPIFAPETTLPDEVDDTAGLDPIFSPDSSSSEPPDEPDGGDATDPLLSPDVSLSGPIDDPIDVEPAPEEAPTVPSFPGRPELGRLYAAVTRVVGATLLDLNAGLREGRDLTDQQQRCLGAFDPAFGEPLLAVDCERALATEPYALYVGLGAFAPTEACRASLASETTDDCVLVAADVLARTDFVPQPPPALPRPDPGSGVVMRFSIDDGVFEVRRDPDAPLPGFRCGYDIVSAAALTTNLGDCDATLRDVAAHVDSLIVDR